MLLTRYVLVNKVHPVTSRSKNNYCRESRLCWNKESFKGVTLGKLTSAPGGDEGFPEDMRQIEMIVMTDNSEFIG